MVLPGVQPYTVQTLTDEEPALNLDLVEWATSRLFLQLCTPDKGLLLVELGLF